MPAMPAYQLAFAQLGLHEQRVQVFEHFFIGLEFLRCRWLLRKLWKAKLRWVSKRSPYMKWKKNR